MIIIATLSALVLAANIPNQDNQADLDDEIIYQASDKAKTIKQANDSLRKIRGNT